MSETKLIPEMLDEEIQMEIRDLGSETGESKKDKVDDLVKLYRLRIDEMKANLEFEIERDKVAAEKERVMREFCGENRKRHEERLSTYLRCGLTAAEILLTLGFNYIWMQKGLAFEETGSFTSTTFRNLISRFKLGTGNKI